MLRCIGRESDGDMLTSSTRGELEAARETTSRSLWCCPMVGFGDAKSKSGILSSWSSSCIIGLECDEIENEEGVFSILGWITMFKPSEIRFVH